MVYTGGCACGAVRYEAQVDEPEIAICHCLPCQVRTASAYSLNLLMPRSGFKITKGEDKLKSYCRIADSEKGYHHRFCGDCGVSIVGIPDAIPDVCSVKAGTLDQPQANFAKINMELYTTRRSTYLPAMEGVTQYEHMLPM